MRSRLFIAVAASLAALLLAVGGLYAYDASRDDLIADGVTIGGVDVGGMRAAAARARITRELARPLEREPLRVQAGRRDFVLTPEEAELRADVEGMVQEALDESRDGNLVTRAYDALADGEEDHDVGVSVTYSQAAVDRLIRRIRHRVDLPAQNARIAYSGAGLEQVASREGRTIRVRDLRRQIATALSRPGPERRLVARTRVVRPEVTTGELEAEYPHFITVSRGQNRLRFYKGLELVKTYVISVGMVGYETPAGLYRIQNKQVDPAWNVPDRDWAGDLRGQVIPGGAPNNPLRERWMGIYNGAGIHGTTAANRLGSAASHGCIRMAVPDVIELYDRVPVQTPIYIG